MRILALVPSLYDTSPGQRFRMEQWARHLEPEGFHFDFVPFEDAALHDVLYQKGRYAAKAFRMLAAIARRARLLRRVDAYDVVYVFREATLLGPPIIESRLAERPTPMVFDFDDAIWVPYVSPSNRSLSRLKWFGKADTICRLSDHVMVGNPHLAEYASKHNDAVSVIPTTIDTEIYTMADDGPSAGGPPVIGWTGSYSTVQHLDTLRQALAELGGTERFRLRVVGAAEYGLAGVEVEALPWRAATEVRDLRPMDIGLMPLPDDPWSRGKCGLKLLQYMALGRPVVGSPVGVNTEIIEDGINGFLASSTQEWVEKLSLLLNDAGLRRRLGAAGRRKVEESYSARVWAPRVGQLLRRVAGHPPAAVVPEPPGSTAA